MQHWNDPIFCPTLITRADGTKWDILLPPTLTLWVRALARKTRKLPRAASSQKSLASDGVSFYERVDAPASPALKALSSDRIAAGGLAGEKITAKLATAMGNGQPIGGIKVIAKSGWFAARPSGTEDVYKIYAESFLGIHHLHQIHGDAQRIIDGLVETA